MTAHPAESGSLPLPPMRTVGGLRAALTMGYGFPGDADDFEAELAREINYADPADLSGVVRLVEEFRGGSSPARTPLSTRRPPPPSPDLRAARGSAR
ncbi:hypothetical protein [Streptomyces sp. e14]|uniref:hypothetical protein n=1 Tax=Streptomyces sp. PD-S100-1 TaxID=3394351 RepID=UPI0012E176B3